MSTNIQSDTTDRVRRLGAREEGKDQGQCPTDYCSRKSGPDQHRGSFLPRPCWTAGYRSGQETTDFGAIGLGAGADQETGKESHRVR